MAGLKKENTMKNITANLNVDNTRATLTFPKGMVVKLSYETKDKDGNNITETYIIPGKGLVVAFQD